LQRSNIFHLIPKKTSTSLGRWGVLWFGFLCRITPVMDGVPVVITSRLQLLLLQNCYQQGSSATFREKSAVLREKKKSEPSETEAAACYCDVCAERAALLPLGATWPLEHALHAPFQNWKRDQDDIGPFSDMGAGQRGWRGYVFICARACMSVSAWVCACMCMFACVCMCVCVCVCVCDRCWHQLSSLLIFFDKVSPCPWSSFRSAELLSFACLHLPLHSQAHSATPCSLYGWWGPKLRPSSLHCNTFLTEHLHFPESPHSSHIRYDRSHLFEVCWGLVTWPQAGCRDREKAGLSAQLHLPPASTEHFRHQSKL
jgi:hypothetical protein